MIGTNLKKHNKFALVARILVLFQFISLMVLPLHMVAENHVFKINNNTVVPISHGYQPTAYTQEPNQSNDHFCQLDIAAHFGGNIRITENPFFRQPVLIQNLIGINTSNNHYQTDILSFAPKNSPPMV